MNEDTISYLIIKNCDLTLNLINDHSIESWNHNVLVGITVNLLQYINIYIPVITKTN